MLNRGQAPVFIPSQWRDASNPIMDGMWAAWSIDHMVKETATSSLQLRRYLAYVSCDSYNTVSKIIAITVSVTVTFKAYY